MSKTIRIVVLLAILFICAQSAVSHHVEGTATTAATTTEDITQYRPGAMTIDRIRQIGTIPNLNEGPIVTINGLSTRLVAWPGQGMVQGAIHLIMLASYQQSKPDVAVDDKEPALYRYPVSEEALECLSGTGEVYLWGKWVPINPGDVAYFPENVKHGIRNKGKDKLVLISQITPPQLTLYESSGLFDDTTGKFNQDKIDELSKSQKGTLRAADLRDMKYRDDNSTYRAWNNKPDTIRQKGAMFNIFKGARFTSIGVPMVIVLFPGYGTRNAGLHTGIIPQGSSPHDHTHPENDDCVIYLSGQGNAIIDGQSINLDPLNAVAAPILVPHGAGNPAPQRSLVSGYGAPPQQELYQQGGYINKDGSYQTPKMELLSDIEKDMSKSQ